MTVSHVESSALLLCASYQALGSILKYKTSHKTHRNKTEHKHGTELLCACYITALLVHLLHPRHSLYPDIKENKKEGEREPVPGTDWK